MALEERQKQIVEGAGREESRLNTEMIDWLKKWGSPLLFIVALGFGAYALYTRYTASQARALDVAFSELTAASTALNPTNLAAVASDHAGRGAVPLMAKLEAADIHLQGFRTGVRSGTKLEPGGALPADEKPLTDDERRAELAKAESLYASVVELAGSARGQRVLAINGHFGLASVAESRGELDKARTIYGKIAAEAKALDIKGLATIAENRASSLDKLPTEIKLLAAAELPGATASGVAPIISPMQNIQAQTSGGQMIQVGPDGQMQIVPASPATPTTPVTPAPTPAPATPAAPAPTP
jgi:hypothetical protein